jgi:hypothetical protein
MTREQILAAIAELDRAIATLQAQLHPPPVDPAERQRLENELQIAQQAHAALLQALANLPPAAAASVDAMARSAKARRRAERVLAAIKSPTPPRKRDSGR